MRILWGTSSAENEIPCKQGMDFPDCFGDNFLQPKLTRRIYLKLNSADCQYIYVRLSLRRGFLPPYLLVCQDDCPSYLAPLAIIDKTPGK